MFLHHSVRTKGLLFSLAHSIWPKPRAFNFDRKSMGTPTFYCAQMFNFKKCILTSTHQIYTIHCDMLKTTHVKSMPRSTIHIFMAWIANFNQMKSDICVKPKIILWHFEWCIFCEGMRLREEMEEMLKGVGGMSSGEGGDILTNNFIVCILLVNVSLFWLITGLTRQYKKYIFWIRFGLANEINNY